MIRLLSLVIVILLIASCAGSSQGTKLTMPYENRLQLASIYIQDDQPEKAVPLLEQAVKQEPQRPEAHAMLGEILFLQDDLEGSTSHLTRALETGGDTPLVLNNLAWVNLKQGHADEALGLIERALSLFPVPVYPYLDTRARIFKALGRDAEALMDARTALRLVPEHDAVMREQLEELIRELEKSVNGAEGEY